MITLPYFGLPVAAVDHDDHPVRALARRQAEVGALLAVSSP